MCGIYLSVARGPPRLPSAMHNERLRARGPDSTSTAQTTLQVGPELYNIVAVATVLSMRGEAVVSQPLVYEHTPNDHAKASHSILCWNGEAWQIGDNPIVGNDSLIVFQRLLDACHADAASANLSTSQNFRDVLKSVTGPFAFVFFDAINGRLLFSRDCLGRRSLLYQKEKDSLIISSVSDPGSTGWREIEVSDGYSRATLPCLRSAFGSADFIREISLPHFYSMSTKLPDQDATRLVGPSRSVNELEQHLQESVRRRIQSLKPHPKAGTPLQPRVAVLFSGGLDCTVLARIVHDFLPATEPIDLLNVAFENPRIHKSLAADVDIYETCPDRITGRAAVSELRQSCLGRAWNFVAINVPFAETERHRLTVTSLIRPHDTEMDLSIAFALYFASRGTGSLSEQSFNHVSSDSLYNSPARTLISGLGADELFGGYQRHATAYSRGGHSALLDELALDVARLGKRNLGRDDRVLSHWARETRFPYLDEKLVAWAVALPVAEKAGFGLVATSDATTSDLPDDKLVLRLLAARLGLPRAAREKKRAIQFGARTAKMSSGKSRGTDALS